MARDAGRPVGSKTDWPEESRNCPSAEWYVSPGWPPLRSAMTSWSSPMPTAGGPRLLLRRLRDIMAEQTSAQMRLDKLVTVITSNMVAEVCSIYLRRAGKVLELFATEGLRHDAVHQTRLKEGEGLVGMVSETAEAVNLSDAPADPHFSYRPETGEDPFKAFLGVPIVRGGQNHGVLT